FYSDIPARAGSYTLSLHDALPIYYRQNRDEAKISMDIAAAYPADAGVISWKREVKLERKKEISVQDSYRLSKHIQPFTENFLSPDRKSTRLNSSHVKISYAVFPPK